MGEASTGNDEQLLCLPLPLKSIGIEIDVLTESLRKASDKVFGERLIRSDRREQSRTQFAVLDVGSISCAIGRTSPLTYIQENQECATIFICRSGSPFYAEERSRFPLTTGMILANPNRGGSYSTNYSSGIYFQINRKLLARTMRAMSGNDTFSSIDKPIIFSPEKQRYARVTSHLFGFIDTLTSEGRLLPTAMGLDDQIYRTAGCLLLENEGKQSRLFKPSSNFKDGANGFDNLIDYIRTNAQNNLTLTDLEEQSHYSGRHLQNLFRDKFDCTPMQFVRRQRLSTAMERLQAGDWNDSVTTIARDCGYRFSSNFSTDFQQEFGVNPSAVLRASRGDAATKKPRSILRYHNKDSSLPPSAKGT